MVRRARVDPLPVLLVEPQYSKRQADQLQNELKKKGHEVKIVEFDTFETVKAEDGRFDKDLYVTVMRRNIDRLAEALP